MVQQLLLDSKQFLLLGCEIKSGREGKYRVRIAHLSFQRGLGRPTGNRASPCLGPLLSTGPLSASEVFMVVPHWEPRTRRVFGCGLCPKPQPQDPSMELARGLMHTSLSKS